jgi:radical SAM protein with 4Fe4S-binding SPASM domain
LTVVSHPILGEHKNIDGVVLHGSDEWFDRTHAELIEKSIKSGMFRPKIPLPFLSLNTCAGYNKNAVAITPDGRLVKCSEQFGDDQTIGDIHTGIVNHELERAWQEIADYDSCARCEFYPHCLQLVHCNAKESCLRFSYLRSIAEKQIREIYSKKKE